jgi:hypothetical protein
LTTKQEVSQLQDLYSTEFHTKLRTNVPSLRETEAHNTCYFQPSITASAAIRNNSNLFYKTNFIQMLTFFKKFSSWFHYCDIVEGSTITTGLQFESVSQRDNTVEPLITDTLINGHLQ